MPTLSDLLREGYVPPTESALADPIKKHFRNLPQTTAENLAKQRQNIDAALQMTPQGIQVADQSAFNSFMNEVPNVAALTAWHGTPHQIKGAFDISKVGTGEGAQSYGHGMYFAEEPKVAKMYQAALSNTKYKVGDRELKGNLYKVDIPDADIPNMLQWDKPLNQQPKSVQKALAKIDPDLYSKKGMDYDPLETGQMIYQRLSQMDMIKNGPFTGASKNVSNMLNAQGIKGIRYSDAGSRGAESGTSNFVVFDPTDVKILEKNSEKVEGLLD